MALSWDPDNAAPLIEAQEDETDVSATVTVTSDDPMDPVESMTWVASPTFPDQVEVTTTANTLTVTIPNFVGFFFIQEIKYLLHGVEGTCTAWADLPADAEDVLEFHPDLVNIRDYTLSITAHPHTASPETKDYLIRVFINYDLGRDALVEAVDARR